MSDSPSLLTTIARLVAPLILIAAGGVGFVMLSKLRSAPASSPPKRLPPMVDTVPVRDYDGGLVFEVDGEVVPYREIALAAEVSGRVTHKSADCQAGHFVKRGALLLQIDPRDYALEIRRLQEMAKQAEASIQELDVERSNTQTLVELAGEELALQKRELARIESLLDRKAASESDVDTARRSELQARNAMKTLENQLRLLSTRRNRLQQEQQRIGAELEKAQLDLQRTEIHAPIDAVVMEDPVEQDAYVQRGTLLAKLEDNSKVEVRFDLRMDQLRWMWSASKGANPAPEAGSYKLPPVPVDVAVDVGGYRFVWAGHLSRYDGAGINAVTRTVPCIAVVDNPRDFTTLDDDVAAQNLPGPPALMRGMFVTLQVRVPSGVPLLAVPETAVQPGNKVWVLRDEKLSIVPVKLAQVVDDMALLLAERSSLSAGDSIIVSPLPVAVAGMPLRDAAGVTSTPDGSEDSDQGTSP